MQLLSTSAEHACRSQRQGLLVYYNPSRLIRVRRIIPARNDVISLPFDARHYIFSTSPMDEYYVHIEIIMLITHWDSN